MNTLTTTPAKVAPIKARHPKVYGEQLAGPVPDSEKPIHFAVWLGCAICALFSVLAIWHLVGHFIKNWN